MRIGLDANAVCGVGSKNRGIGNYCTDMIEALVRGFPEDEFFLLNCCENAPFGHGISGLPNFHEEFHYIAPAAALHCGEAATELTGEVVRSFVAANRLDAFLVTSPFDTFYPTYSREWFGDIPVAAIVYDIIPYVFKKRYLGSAEVMKNYMKCVDFLRTCDRLCVISQSAKDDLVSYLDFPAEKIDVIWGSVGRRFVEQTVPAATRAELARRYGVKDGFIICTGGDDERKNIGGLIGAYARLPREVREEHQLVVVCKLGRESEQRYRKLAQDRGAGDSVILTNFVSDEALVALYNMAGLCAFVSKYEGFGLPIVEAWRCGTPVVTADNSSLVQIAGDAAVVVDADDERSIADGLLEALGNLPELTRRGRERAALYTWERTDELLTESFRTIVSEHSAKKRRIAVFAPLPPQRSGIADYSLDVISELRKYYDIDVFVEDTGTVDPIPAELANVRVLPHRDYRKENYFRTVFEMGNSDFHFYMYPYIRSGGGIVELHDLNLHDAARIYSSIYGAELFDGWLREEYSEEEIAAVAVDDELTVNGFLVDRADSVVVHSGYAKRRLLERDFSRTVRFLPLYSLIEPLDGGERARAREALELPADGKLFAAFGFLHETKRSMPLLRAFREALDRAKEPDKLRLVYVGAYPRDEYAEEFRALIAELGLEDRVTVTGYIELADFVRYIDAADLCINLRWPYNGETSAALTRALSRGRGVMINDVGSFAEIPESCCIRLPSVADMTEEEEIRAIADGLVRAADDERLPRRMGESARAFAERELDLRACAERLAQIIAEPTHSRLGYDRCERLIAAETDLARAAGKPPLGGDVPALLDTIAYAKDPFPDSFGKTGE